MTTRRFIGLTILFLAGAGGMVWFAQKENKEGANLSATLSSPSPVFHFADSQNSASVSTLNPATAPAAEPTPTPIPTPAGPQVKVSSLSAKQGEMAVVTVENAESNSAITGAFDGKNFNFLPVGAKKYIGFVGIHAQLKPGIYTLSVNPGTGGVVTKNIQVIEQKFPTTVLYVSDELKDKGFSENNIIESQGASEGKIISDAIAGYTSIPYFQDSFLYPLKTIKDVGAFGNIRRQYYCH
ncbi:MAG: hypothetical protein HYV77_03970 [Candidatus Wildermuthbacteria bacterium]|nr:hypothetical protein [Candidatus Wildermuthbacteria bacterium]